MCAKKMPPKKRKMNEFMKRLQQARKSNAATFQYTANDGKTKTYARGTTKTGMVIYKERKQAAKKPAKKKKK